MEKNSIDANLYNEKSLYLLNIRELRDMGRKFGVPSPTTMKKRDLVDYILKVVYGEVEPPLRNSCGRPNSREFDMNKYVDKIKKNTDLTEQLKEVRLSYDNTSSGGFGLKFTLTSPTRDANYIGTIEQRVVFRDSARCVLRVRQFIESENDIVVDKHIADKLKLENFDVVEIISSSGGIKIISINGKKIANNIKSFKVLDDILSAGTRKVFYLRTKEEVNEITEKIKRCCDEQNLKLIVLGTKKVDGADSFEVIESENELRFKKIMMFVEHCKKLVYENQDIVILVQDKSLVEEVVARLEADVSVRVKAHLNEDFTHFVNLGNIFVMINMLRSLNY